MEAEFRDELIARVKRDQDMRRSTLEDESKWDADIDRSNTLFLKAYVISGKGWPTYSELGAEGSTAAWLLVQHADHDVAFQTECLERMKSLPDGEIDKTRIAFLEDRILTNQNKAQLYGTQFKIGENFGPLPIEDIGNLDIRRAEMGLSSFREYEGIMRQQYG